MPLRKRIEGVMVALATPLREDESVDEAGLRALIRRVLVGGVHGLVVLGTAGEFVALGDEEKKRAIAVVLEEVGGRVPVIVGTGEAGTRKALALTRFAARAGADAAIVVPPYYFHLDQAAVLRHYRLLAAEGDLPIMLYNIPFFTGVSLEVATVCQLAAEEGIVGIKDSGGNFGYYQRLLLQARSEKFSVVTGSDDLFYASLTAGGDGNISPGANIAPAWFVALWAAVREQRLDEAWALQRRIITLSSGVFRHGVFPAGLKAALALLGIGRNIVSAPIVALSDAQLQDVRVALDEAELR
jgi:4-hydroxy-tetrahydrodipicolinate synthase